MSFKHDCIREFSLSSASGQWALITSITAKFAFNIALRPASSEPKYVSASFLVSSDLSHKASTRRINSAILDLNSVVEDWCHPRVFLADFRAAPADVEGAASSSMLQIVSVIVCCVWYDGSKRQLSEDGGFKVYYVAFIIIHMVDAVCARRSSHVTQTRRKIHRFKTIKNEHKGTLV